MSGGITAVVKEIIREAEDKMHKTVEAFRRDLASMKAGRATPAILDKVLVEYYGSMTPVNQLANISVPEARMITIQPYDKSAIKAIEKAIMVSDLGMTPNNDGVIIRLNIPALTEERRRDLVKQLHKKAEEDRVIVRNHRRDANDMIKSLEKEKSISEDEARRATEDVQKLTDKFIKDLDAILANKEKEVLEV